jgi:outer membrane autotransporter protein
VELTPGQLTLGAFFEYGNGSYDTYNSFSNAASVKGDGDMYYLGGGILARMDFNRAALPAIPEEVDKGRTAASGEARSEAGARSGQSDAIKTASAAQEARPSGLYIEASGRAGGLHNDYSSGDLRDYTGRKAEYDSSSAYYGLHFGTGYIWNINEKAGLDLYGKYFWTHQEGDSVKLSTDDQVRFKDVDSHRLRGGARFAYTVNESVSPYIGAAYEHEFDGKARATSYGYSIKAPDLTGGTGIGELGLSFKPSPTLPLSFDLGVQGYVGKREGVTGSLQAKWEF